MANDEIPSGGTGGGGTDRGHWNTRIGFMLAAAGSAVGLGNIWKFPYITGENGGGLFVLIYLVCIALVGLPVMIGEIMIGRRAQRSPVQAFGELSGNNIAWKAVGLMGVITGFVLLSFYSIVAGWALDYVVLFARGALSNMDATAIQAEFQETVYPDTWNSVVWHAIFMTATIGIVVGGVSRGIEKAAKVLMPLLFLLFIVLLVDAAGQKGFGDAADFVFGPDADKLTGPGVLEALGHSFFTLSLGMGALITYGSYLRRSDDIVVASGAISLMDTAVALMACMVMFPIIFSFGMEPGQGAGLAFISMPIAFTQMTAGTILGTLFFVLLVFAALTSAISLLEVVVSTIIDIFGWSRIQATLIFGGAIFVLGILSADTTGEFTQWWIDIFDKNVMDSFDWAVSNVALPLGGLFIALFVGWAIPAEHSRDEFTAGTNFGNLYPGWLILIRYLVPIAILLVFLNAVGLIDKLGIFD